MEHRSSQNTETEITKKYIQRSNEKDDLEESFLSHKKLEEYKIVQEVLLTFSRTKPKNKSDLRKFLINIAASSTRLLALLEDESIPKNQNGHFGQKNDRKNEQIPRVSIQKIGAGRPSGEGSRDMSQHENNDHTMNDQTSGSTSSQCIGFLQKNTTQTLLQKDEICNTQLNNETEIVFECKNVEPTITSFVQLKLDHLSQSQLEDSEIGEATRSTIKDEQFGMVKKELNSNNGCKPNEQTRIIPPLNSIRDSEESEKLETCSEELEKNSNLKVHKDTAHNHATHSCEICGKKFMQKLKLEFHTKVVHNRRKLYQCDTCGKTFVLKNELDRHINSIHIDIAYDASRKTQRDYLISRISSVHYDQKSHERGTHGKAFRQKVSPKEQIELPRRSITHTCESCGKTFTRKERLKDHIDFVHKYLHHHKCDRCQKAFSSKGVLNFHMSTVHNRITYKCDVCEKTFTRKDNLRFHINTLHMSDGKLFKCDECLKSFNYKCQLTSHIEYAHKGVTHPCDLCQKVFTQKCHLKRHKDSVHKGIAYPCDQCEKSYSSKTYLKLHIDRIHNGKKPNT